MNEKLTAIIAIGFMLLCVFSSPQQAIAKKLTLDQCGWAFPVREFHGWLDHIDEDPADCTTTAPPLDDPPTNTWVDARWSSDWPMPLPPFPGFPPEGAKIKVAQTWYSNHDYSDVVDDLWTCDWVLYDDVGSFRRLTWTDKDIPPPADYKIVLIFHAVGVDSDFPEYRSFILEVHHLGSGVVRYFETYDIPPGRFPDCED